MLRDLDNKESILLMYLAGELPDDDRLEVTQMLARDPSLALELEKLRADWASARRTLARLDELAPPPVPDAVSIRQATRLLKQWQEKQWEEVRLRYVLPAEPKVLRFPWWSYPLATAAAIALALLVWWSNLDNLQSLPSSEFYASGRNWNGGGWMGLGLNSFETDEIQTPTHTEELWADNLEKSFDISDELLDQALTEEGLAQAELELLALHDRRSEFPDALFVHDESDLMNH